MMEMIRLNIVYDLLQTTKLSSNSVEKDKILQRTSNSQVYFVICNSCYWCASYFDIDDLGSALSSHVLDCRICNSHTELIPISSDGSFKTKLAN